MIQKKHKKMIRLKSQKMRKTYCRMSSTKSCEKESESQTPGLQTKQTLDDLKFYDSTLPEMHDHQEPSDSCELSSDDECMADFSLQEEVKRIKSQYHFKMSSSSTDITDIQGIIYGGITSRFWIYRKHMCSLDFSIISNDSTNVKKSRRKILPFYAWQCITLVLKDRMVDLVIKNEKNMDLFIRFLVISLNTIDGYKNTAEPYIIASYKHELKLRAKQLKDTFTSRAKGNQRVCLKRDLQLSQESKEQIKLTKKIALYQKTCLKFKLMRIRSKISYQAF